ncbi:MAG: Nramp family divalent metal transporter [Anaerolineae bacterium]
MSSLNPLVRRLRGRGTLRSMLKRVALFLAILGPGLITASADNDAPGIATYSMAGSRYGYSFLWLLAWITLGEVLVQEMAARMGTVTGKGLTDLIRERYGVRLTFFVMVGLLLANLGTTAAQFAGIASSAELFGLSRYAAVPIAALAVWLLVTRGTYRVVEKVLLVISLYAVAYIASAFMSKPDWGEVLHATVVPQLQGGRDYMLALLATVGTTITPWAAVYMQASVADRRTPKERYAETRLDVVFGAAIGNIVSAFIVICTAATLYPAGIVVETAEEAAMALAPVAGTWAQMLFGIGLMGASLLAVSVLPLATTYALCEAFGWERGLDRKPHEAPVFYGLYVGILVIAAALVLIPGIKLFPLMWLSQVANAVLLPVFLVLMLQLGSNKRVMRGWENGKLQNLLVGLLSMAVVAATIVLVMGGAVGS